MNARHEFAHQTGSTINSTASLTSVPDKSYHSNCAQVSSAQTGHIQPEFWRGEGVFCGPYDSCDRQYGPCRCGHLLRPDAGQPTQSRSDRDTISRTCLAGSVWPEGVARVAEPLPRTTSAQTGPLPETRRNTIRCWLSKSRGAQQYSWATRAKRLCVL